MSDLILDAWGWCTEMTQRDGMGREEGGEMSLVVSKFTSEKLPVLLCKGLALPWKVGVTSMDC